MNKPALVGSALLVGLAAFVAGRYTSSNPTQHASARRVLYYVDPMHPAYRSDKPGSAPDCGMALEPVYEGDDPAAKLQLAPGAVALSPEKQSMIGARVETVARNSGARMIRTTGRIAVDENRVYRVTAVTDGRVTSLGDNPAGTLVKKDQVLASFYSREFRNAEQAYLGSMTSVERMHSAGRDSDDANLRINEEQLRALGMGEPQIKELARTKLITRDIEVTSPVDGLVLQRNIAQEERFDGHVEMYRIADISKIWILADLLGDEGAVLRPGARVKVTVRELGKTLNATVSSTPPVFDPTSRTLKLRLEADNPGRILRPDMFADIEFNSSAPPGISVPAEAVLDSGMRKVVYVETSDNVFEPRTVEVGAAFGNRITVKAGLAEGERVVTAGNFMIDSESRMRSTVPPSDARQSKVPQSMSPVASSPKAMAAMASMDMPKASMPEASDMPKASMPRASDVRQASPKLAAVAVEAVGSTVDPACGMPLSSDTVKASKYSANYRGHKFVFCSENCQKKFQGNPEKYVGQKAQTTPSGQAGIGAP